MSEHLEELLVREVAVGSDPEGSTADHQLQHGVDPLGGRQAVPRALPRLGPHLGRRPDDVLAHLQLLLRGESSQGARTRHQRREGVVQARDVDAGRTVLALVGTGVRLLQDHEILEGTPRVVVQLTAELVGTTLRFVVPVTDLVPHRELQPAVDLLALVLLQEGLQPDGVRNVLGAGDHELPLVTLLGVEDVQGATTVLAVVEGDVGTLLEVQLAVLEAPAVLEGTAGVLREGDLLIGRHREGHLPGTTLLEPTLDAHLVGAEALDPAELDHLTGGQLEGEHGHIPLAGDDDGVDAASFLGTRLGEQLGELLVFLGVDGVDLARGDDFGNGHWSSNQCCCGVLCCSTTGTVRCCA